MGGGSHQAQVKVAKEMLKVAKEMEKVAKEMEKVAKEMEKVVSGGMGKCSILTNILQMG